jgi:hypothetical protein
MAERSGKKTSAKDERGVLGSLSATRPSRLGRERPQAPPPPPPPPLERSSDPERVIEAAQAVGRLVQAGVNVLKGAASKLPRV